MCDPAGVRIQIQSFSLNYLTPANNFIAPAAPGLQSCSERSFVSYPHYYSFFHFISLTNQRLP
jgi:hypothetical protein